MSLVRLVADPAVETLAFTLCGVALGTISGLVPGLHANTFALGLAALAPSLPGSTLSVGAAVLAAGVVHTFLDVVPSLALGVPDAAMAAGALPGHRLVLGGRGREALRLSALGSGLAVFAALVVAVPVTTVVTAVYPALRAHLPVALGIVVALLLLTEQSHRARLGALVVLAASGLLGQFTLELSPTGPLAVGSVLMPLFAGLFGAPVLLDAVGGDGVPPQADAQVALSPRDVGVTALAGTGAGALVGYLPGVSAAVGSTLSLAVLPDRDARRFVVATSGANTANTVFALFALFALGTPRTGVMVALTEASVPLARATLVGATVVAGAVGFLLVPVVGDRYLATVGRFDATRLSLGVLCVLVGCSYLFAGPVGLAVVTAATAVGSIPPRLGTARVYLMGVLFVPLALSG